MFFCFLCEVRWQLTARGFQNFLWAQRWSPHLVSTLRAEVPFLLPGLNSFVPGLWLETCLVKWCYRSAQALHVLLCYLAEPRSCCLLSASSSSPIASILASPFCCFIFKDLCQATHIFRKWCSWLPWLCTCSLTSGAVKRFFSTWFEGLQWVFRTHWCSPYQNPCWPCCLFLILSLPYSFMKAFDLVSFWIFKCIPTLARSLHPQLMVWFLHFTVTPPILLHLSCSTPPRSSSLVAWLWPHRLHKAHPYPWDHLPGSLHVCHLSPHCLGQSLALQSHLSCFASPLELWTCLLHVARFRFCVYTTQIPGFPHLSPLPNLASCSLWLPFYPLFRE